MSYHDKANQVSSITAFSTTALKINLHYELLSDTAIAYDFTVKLIVIITPCKGYAIDSTVYIP